MTRLFKISTPAPASMLKETLEKKFPDKSVEKLDHDDFESCIMINLSYEEIKEISEIGDCLIHELKYSIDKEIIIK